ncbi:MAG: sulfatase [Candidatus Hermodarchaeota archaeon]
MVNVILLTIDCLRADFTGTLANNEILTPNLNKFAKEGILFTQAIANGPSTPFSFPSIFTSTYALMDSNFPEMSSLRRSIPELLEEKGFKTAGFHSNPYLSKVYKYDKFFEFFYDSISDESENYKRSNKLREFIKRHKIIKNLSKKFLNFFGFKYKLEIPYKTAKAINQKALKWLENREGDFFVWIHYMDTHHPFLPPEKYRTISYQKLLKLEKVLSKNSPNTPKKKILEIIEAYKGTIKYVDNEIGVLFDKLNDLDLYNNSLIIITADHGEEFMEHGDFSHQAKLYEELIHIPLYIKGPKLPKGETIDDLISLIDIPPTILNYLEFEKNPSYKGKSILSLIKKEPDKYVQDGVITETLAKEGKVILSLDEGSRIISYRTKNWKLILNFEKDMKELFNLDLDPKEIKNVYDQNKDIARNYEEILLEHIKMEKANYSKSKELKLIKDSIKKIKI